MRARKLEMESIELLKYITAYPVVKIDGETYVQKPIIPRWGMSMLVKFDPTLYEIHYMDGKKVCTETPNNKPIKPGTESFLDRIRLKLTSIELKSPLRISVMPKENAIRKQIVGSPVVEINGRRYYKVLLNCVKRLYRLVDVDNVALEIYFRTYKKWHSK